MKEVALACPGCEELEERLSDAFETLRALPRFRTDVLLAPHLCTSNALVATLEAVKLRSKEVEHESATLWETEILRGALDYKSVSTFKSSSRAFSSKGIHDVERKIFEARGPGPDGKEWHFRLRL